MSALEEKAKATKHETGEDSGTPAGDGNGAGSIILFFVIGLAASLVVGWVIFPKLLYSEKRQPIDFNHAMHVELVDQGCQSCHFLRADGTFSGAPKLAQCADCHSEVQGTSPEEVKFVEEYLSKGREVPWLIYAKQPDCVFFSHAAHIQGGEMDCATCHGPIGESESLKPYQANRLTGYSREIWGKNIGGLFKMNTWDSMKMDDCADCHKRENVRQASVQTQKDGCFVCHK